MSAPASVDLEAVSNEQSLDENERMMQLWLKAGHGAMIFCMWCVFVIPILLTIEMRW